MHVGVCKGGGGDTDISLDGNINTYAFLRRRTERCYEILSLKNYCCSFSECSNLPCKLRLTKLVSEINKTIILKL